MLITPSVNEGYEMEAQTGRHQQMELQDLTTTPSGRGEGVSTPHNTSLTSSQSTQIKNKQTNKHLPLTTGCHLIMYF